MHDCTPRLRSPGDPGSAAWTGGGARPRLSPSVVHRV